MNLTKHTIYQAIYDLCVEIEKLPASEQQTKVVTMAGALEKNADVLVDALRDCLDAYKSGILVTSKQVEKWKEAAEVSRSR